MALKSYRLKTKRKEKEKESEFIKKPLRTGLKLGLGFAALGLGLSALDRI